MRHKKLTLLFFAGALSGLSFPPYSGVITFFLSCLSFSYLLYTLDIADTKKRSFLAGYFFGLGHFLVGLYWISNALFVDIKTFWYLLPLALFGIPAILAVYFGLVTLLTNLLEHKTWKKAICFSLLFVLFEYLRGVLFTGFPWNLIGYSLTFSNNISQITSIIGIHGLSLIAIFLMVIPYITYKSESFNPLIIPAMIFGILITYGSFRLLDETQSTSSSVRIVQPNISQDIKWESGRELKNLLNIMNLTLAPSNNNIDLILWPESAFNFPVYDGAPILDALRKAIPKGAILATGALRTTALYHDKLDMWNSIVFIDHEGGLVNFYDKHHLVPFGEYVPFRRFLPFDIRKITHGMRDFNEGRTLKSLSIKELPLLSTLVCYEVIFPSRVSGNINDQLLINVTNDGWYGASSGPYQHFEAARIRTIEEGLPLLRAANTGISAVIDPYGRVIEKLDLQTKGIIDQTIPEAIKNRTLFSKTGNRPLITLIVVLLAIFSAPAVAQSIKSRIKHTEK